MATRKYFTKEFKLEAVRLLEQSGKSGTELARHLGVRCNQLACTGSGLQFVY